MKPPAQPLLPAWNVTLRHPHRQDQRVQLGPHAGDTAQQGAPREPALLLSAPRPGRSPPASPLLAPPHPGTECPREASAASPFLSGGSEAQTQASQSRRVRRTLRASLFCVLGLPTLQVHLPAQGLPQKPQRWPGPENRQMGGEMTSLRARGRQESQGTRPNSSPRVG